MPNYTRAEAIDFALQRHIAGETTRKIAAALLAEGYKVSHKTVAEWVKAVAVPAPGTIAMLEESRERLNIIEEVERKYFAYAKLAEEQTTVAGIKALGDLSLNYLKLLAQVRGELIDKKEISGKSAINLNLSEYRDTIDA